MTPTGRALRSLLPSMLALFVLVGCGKEEVRPAATDPSWFVGRWVFDLEASARRLDALGVPKDAKPGDDAMTRGVLEGWDAAGVVFDVGPDGALAQASKAHPAPDARYRWRAIAPEEIEIMPSADNPSARMGLASLRLRRMGDGVESYKPRWPIRTKGGDFRHLYRRAPK